MLFEKFYPDSWMDSTYVIDFDQLYKEGYRGLIFDIDNTLVPHGAPAERAGEKAVCSSEGTGIFLLSVVE